MALSRVRKTSHLYLNKTFLPPSRPFNIFFQTKISQNETNPSIPTPNSEIPLRKITHSFVNPVNSFPSADNSLANELVAIFIKPQSLRNREELQSLGTRLTTLTVETVLRNLKSWKIAQEFFDWASTQDGYRHNCYTYNAMASILCWARKRIQLRALAMDLIYSRCSMSAGAFGFFLRCLGSLGLVEEANWLFDQAKLMGICVPNNYSYNCLLEVLAKSCCVDLVEMRLREMRKAGWDPDKFTLTPVLQVYCNARKCEEALEVFNQIYEKGWVDSHVSAILLLSFSKWGEVDKAFELFERMEDLNISLNEKTFCILIHGFVRESRVEKALQLFDKMRKLGFTPDLSLYDALLGGICKKKALGKALDLYSDMKDCGVYPDVRILAKLVSLSCAEGDAVKANQLLEEWGEGLDSNALVLLYNAFLNGLVNHGLIDRAYLLIQEMIGPKCNGEAVCHDPFWVDKKITPNTTSFNIVVDGLCKTRKLDVALGLFRDMVQMGCARNLLLYNNLIDELCRMDRLEKGLELLKEMKESGFRPTEFTYNAIFGCLCRREDVAGALNIVREMQCHGHEPWIKHCSLLVKQLCTHGKAMEACNFLTEMVRQGFIPDIISYSAAIDGFFKIREVDRAMELFQDICAHGYYPDVVAFNILINGLCKNGRVLEAQDALNEMLEKGLVPSVVTYNLIIDGWFKRGDIDQALHFFSRLLGDDKEPTIITYTTLINGLCNAGRPDDALVIWNEMDGKGCCPNRIAYMALIHGLCKCSRVDAALLHLRKMEEKEMRPDSFVYTALIHALISISNPLLAFEVLKEMVQNGDFPGPFDKDYLLISDAISKLSGDARTSSGMKNLIADGCIAKIPIS